MKTRYLPLLKFFGLCLLTWSLVIGTGIAIRGELFANAFFTPGVDIDRHPGNWILIGLAFAAMLMTGGFALRLPLIPRWARTLFWVPLLPGTAFLGTAFADHWDLVLGTAYPAHMAAGVLIVLAAMIWMGVQIKRSGQPISRGWAGELGAAVGCLLLPALLASAFNGLKAGRLRQEADARWAQLGRPMDQFGRQLVHTEQNASFNSFEADLKGLGVPSLYKMTSRAWVSGNQSNSFTCPPAELDFLCVSRAPADEVPAPAKPLEYLAAHHGQLSALYANVLRQEAPVWRCRQEDGYRAAVPNFLTMRMLAQLSGSEALRQLHEGDLEGAAQTSEAILKASQNLGEQPFLVSLMIHVAIEVTVPPILARLPEDPQAWAALEKNAAGQRARFLSIIQSEAYALRSFEFDSESAARRWPRFKGRLHEAITRAAEIDKTQGVLAYAEMLEVLQNLKVDPLGDLGAGAMEAALLRHPSQSVANFSLSFARINCALILREQAEMVRFARARMQEGVLTAARDSVVIAGSRWEMSGDAATHSARLKLTPLPPWLVDSPVAPREFFLMALDGRQPWVFKPAAPAPSRLSSIAN